MVCKSPEWFASLLGERPVQRLVIVLGLAAIPSTVLSYSHVALQVRPTNYSRDNRGCMCAQLLPYCGLRLAAETFIVAAVAIGAHIVFNRARE